MLDEIKRAFSENKYAVVASAAIMFVSMILGYYLEPHLYSYLNPVVDDLTQKVQTGVIRLTFADIFSNNFRIILQMLIYGIIFCFSAVILSFNGFFVGYYVAISHNFYEVMLFIIPHGIFEFSSCIIACAAGFVLFNFLYKFIKTFVQADSASVLDSISIATDESFDKFRQALILFCVAVILMAVAGIIEAYLTLPIAQFILSLG